MENFIQFQKVLLSKKKSKELGLNPSILPQQTFETLDTMIQRLPQEIDIFYKIIPRCNYCQSKLKWQLNALDQCTQILCQQEQTTQIYSRWYCRNCDIKYCVNCQRPPTYGGYCPLEHQMKLIPGDGQNCDSCCGIIKGFCYRDLECNFDLCRNCFKFVEKED